MILNFCIACGEEDATKLENHHLVPRSAGGSDDPTNLITLCHVCHGKAHGYQRLNVRVLSAAGVAKAKANGKKSGNPGLRNGDPAALQKIAEARDAMHLSHLKSTANIWLPIVQRMRPLQGWEVVASAIKTETGQDWNVAKLRRAVGRLVSEGLADPTLLDRAPWGSIAAKAARVAERQALKNLMSEAEKEKMAKYERALAFIGDVLGKVPDINIRVLAAYLELEEIEHPHGGTNWSTSFLYNFINRSRSKGLLPPKVSQPSDDVATETYLG